MTKQKNCGMRIAPRNPKDFRDSVPEITSQFLGAECGLKNIELNDNIEELYPESKSEIRTGFTLIELLIALSISSIIFLVIISTYSLSMNTLGKWDKKEESCYLSRNIFRRMQNEISSLCFTSDSKSDTSAVEGDEKNFSFYTTAKSLYFPFSCLIKVTYRFTSNDEGKNLLLREEKPLVNFSLEEKTYIKSYVWSEDLKDLSFKYSDGKNWYDSWNPGKNSQTLRAVKIVLISPDEQTLSTIIYIPTEI